MLENFESLIPVIVISISFVLGSTANANSTIDKSVVTKIAMNEEKWEKITENNEQKVQLYTREKKRSGDDNTSTAWPTRSQNFTEHQLFESAYKIDHRRYARHIKFLAR